MKQLRSIKGTHDILPNEIYKWKQLETIVSQACEQFGYHEIRNPIFEETGLCSRSVGEKTDKVTDVVNMGDTLDVKYFGVDPRTRKDKVSRKALLPKPEGYVDKPRKTFNRNNNRKGFNKK